MPRTLIFFHGMFEDPDRCLKYFKGQEWKGWKIRAPDLEKEEISEIRKEIVDCANTGTVLTIGHSAGCAWLLHATRGLAMKKILISPVVQYSQMPWGYKIYRKLHLRSDAIYRYLIKHYCDRLGADLRDMKTYLPSARYLYITRNILKKGPVLNGDIISVICSGDQVVNENPETLQGAKTEYFTGYGHGLNKGLMRKIRKII